MLHTPKWILGEGFPLPTPEAQKENAPIWSLAFKLHQISHNFEHDSYHPSTINTMEHSERSPYCDCFVRAWLGYKIDKKFLGNTPLVSLVDFIEPKTVFTPPIDEEYYERVV